MPLLQRIRRFRRCMAERHQPWEGTCLLVVLFWILFRHCSLPKSRYVQKIASTFCRGQWLGNFPKNDRVDDCVYHVVVSHCSADLTWLEHELDSSPCTLRSLTIYSKCELTDAEGLSTLADLAHLKLNFSHSTLQNVGRCDHTYAHHMATIMNYDGIDKEVFVFLKDTTKIHQPGFRRELSEMIQMARGPVSFSCGMIPRAPVRFKYADLSIWHESKELSKFRLKTYKHSAQVYKQKPNEKRFPSIHDFRRWAESMEIHLPQKAVTPVCYGGNFATSGSQVKKYDRIFWQRVERALSRGNSIEEGHFMERLWAHLLVQRDFLTSDEHILQHAVGTIREEYQGLRGTLYGCKA